MPRTGQQAFLRDGCNKLLPDPACEGSKWIEERYTAPVSLRPESKNAYFFHQRQARGGHGFAGALSPNSVPHMTSAPFFFYGPMKAFGPCASSAPPWWEPASSWEKSWERSSASETFRRARYRLQDQ